ncbi:hypothetical protein [Inquilinus limosus]|nr:hypothetical protein [Inquilinus limosus]
MAASLLREAHPRRHRRGSMRRIALAVSLLAPLVALSACSLQFG